MEQYLGVKLVNGEPCSQDQFAGAKNIGDLSKLSGAIDQDGYKVVYEDEYISWSPKDVFEKAYRKIKLAIPKIVTKNEWQDRVVKEAEDLLIKTFSLDKFIEYNIAYTNLSSDEQIRLKQQLMAMQYYLTILIERIENF